MSTNRVVGGILVELLALAGALLLALRVPAGLPLGLYVALAQLMVTYLVHCPAHFVVGRAVGVRFRTLRFGRTTLARFLPLKLKCLAGILPVLTLSTDRSSLAGVSRRGLAAMYASGTVASAGSAVAIAVSSTLTEALPYSLLAWAIAVAYVAFDIAFSPRSGDLMRARAVLVT